LDPIGLEFEDFLIFEYPLESYLFNHSSIILPVGEIIDVVKNKDVYKTHLRNLKIA
jgi:hypothetical protein